MRSLVLDKIKPRILAGEQVYMQLQLSSRHDAGKCSLVVTRVMS